MLPLPLTMPVLLEAAAHRDRSQSSNPVQATLADLRTSPDRVERDSIYLGRVVADGSPVLVPRDVFREHALGLGDSGAGKTAGSVCQGETWDTLPLPLVYDFRSQAVTSETVCWNFRRVSRMTNSIS